MNIASQAATEWLFSDLNLKELARETTRGELSRGGDLCSVALALESVLQTHIRETEFGNQFFVKLFEHSYGQIDFLKVASAFVTSV